MKITGIHHEVRSGLAVQTNSLTAQQTGRLYAGKKTI